MSYTMYTPLNVWLDPASVTDVVAYIQTYLRDNPIYSTTEIETLIHDYLIAHPELIGGVQSVNGKTGTVVLSASDIKTENDVTIESVLASLSSQISTIAANVATNTTNITGLTGRMTTAETDISNLKISLLTGEVNVSSLNIIYNEYVNLSGAFETYTGWDRTDFISCDGYEKIYIICPPQTVSIQYNAFYQDASTSSFVSLFNVVNDGLAEIDVPASAKYFVLSNQRLRLRDMKIYGYCRDSIEQLKDTKLDKSVFDAIATVDFSPNLLNTETVVNGYYVEEGVIKAYATYSYTDFMPVVGGQTYLFTYLNNPTTFNTNIRGYVNFYDSSKTIINGTGQWSTSGDLFTAPANAAFCIVSAVTEAFSITNKPIFCLSSYTITEGVMTINEYKPFGDIVEINPDVMPYLKLLPWSNKKWCDFGDSIAYATDWCVRANNVLGADTIYNRGIGSSAVSNNGQSPAYVTMSGELIGRYQGDMDAYHALVAGLTEGVDYYEISTTMMCSTERVGTIPLDSDVVSILAGMNDFETITAETLGDVDDIWDGTTESTKTFCGAYRRMLELIHARVPNANIIICVPTKYAAEYTNGTRTASLVINEQMREKIREIGKAYGCKVIDFATLFSPVRATQYNASTNPYGWLMDNVHPNTNGQNAMGDMFAQHARDNYFST